MASAAMHHFPGGTNAQYEASTSTVHPARDGSYPSRCWTDRGWWDDRRHPRIQPKPGAVP